MIEEPCPFCAILSSGSEVSYVYHDDAVVAFMDHQPITAGHLLVVPRQHLERVADLDDVTWMRVWHAVRRITGALERSGAVGEGMNVLVLDGEAGFQDVAHFHVHLVPRTAGDGFSLTFPPGYGAPTNRPQLDAYAAHLRGLLAD